jgi:fido (protein-threonine AMPylation protein)
LWADANYEYIDPDYTYTDPQTGVLRNMASIADADGLLFFESAVVVKRAKELGAQPIEIQSTDRPKLAESLAVLLGNINYLHPFREGNGRTQREYIRVLALEKSYALKLNPPDNLNVYERYIAGTIDGDIEKLKALILELMQKEK